MQLVKVKVRQPVHADMLHEHLDFFLFVTVRRFPSGNQSTPKSDIDFEEFEELYWQVRNNGTDEGWG